MQALRAAARPARGIRAVQQGLIANAVRTYKTPVSYVPETPSKDPQLAGYPELPYVSKQRRQPYGWDDPQMRRNFGETVSSTLPLELVAGPISVSSSFMSTKKCCLCGVRTRP